MCFELNSTIKASNANFHIFKQIGAPPISQNSWGCNSVCVSTIHDANDKINHFSIKKKNMTVWSRTEPMAPKTNLEQLYGKR